MNASNPTVMLLVNTFDIGGAERVYSQLARGLAGRGYRVFAACLQARSGAVARELEGSGVTIIDLDVQRANPLGLLRLFGVLRQHRVDVLYTFLIHSHVVGRIAAKLAGVPVVVSSQQTMGWESHTPELLNRVTARWCTAVVGVSRSVQQYLAERVGIPSEKLSTIYNCVDLDRFWRVDVSVRPILERGLTIGSVARLNPEKDHDTLFAAFAIVSRQYPSATLLLAGEGPERPRLEQLARDTGIADRITFVGHISDTPSFYERLDVYVQSSHVEGMSVAILEAAACGLPIVATQVGGNAEAVLDGETGLLIPPRSPDAFADAICRLLAIPAAAQDMGARARQRAHASFGVDRMVDDTAHLFNRLLLEQADGRFVKTS